MPGQGDLADGQARSGIDEGLDPPHDTALAVDDYGTTPAEMRSGEPLDGRLAREQPDLASETGGGADESGTSGEPISERAGQGIGRLVEPDEGARSDTESDLVATDVGTDLGGYSAEEAAMHLAPEA